MANEKILMVDDEEDLLELVNYNLKKNGYIIDTVTTGEDALEQVRTSSPDLILLDLMLPGIDGLDVCRIVKNDAKTSHIPIIMISAKGEEADIVIGLEIGADDYITKPFSPRILAARVKSVLRRGRDIDNATVYSKHDITVNMATHEAHVLDNPLKLTAGEFNILSLMLKRPGWVFTRNQIIDATKGGDYPVTDRSIDVQVVGLRKKLDTHGAFIETVRGVGYRLKE
jgi:two-component system, OmpR family, alkaline phosphatase synthesis response regulator PhoP